MKEGTNYLYSSGDGSSRMMRKHWTVGCRKALESSQGEGKVTRNRNCTRVYWTVWRGDHANHGFSPQLVLLVRLGLQNILKFTTLLD